MMIEKRCENCAYCRKYLDKSIINKNSHDFIVRCVNPKWKNKNINILSKSFCNQWSVRASLIKKLGDKK